MPKSTPRPMNSTAKATEIRFSAPTIARPAAAVKLKPTARLIRTARMIRVCFSASHTLIDRAPIGDGEKFLVRQGHRAGEAHRHAPVRRQTQFGDRRPDGFGRIASGLPIAVIEDGLG